MNETPETQPTQSETTQSLPAQPATTSRWRSRPTMLIGGTVAAAALLIGGASIGAAVADDDDDDRPVAAQTRNQTNADDDADDVTPAPSSAAADTVASVGAKDAGALSTVLAAARGESKGTVTSMEANRDGSWSVDLESTRGDETTVRVAADGKASVVRTEAADADDANDPAPAGTLSDTNLTSIVKAALGEARGTIVDIDLDDQPAEAYSVQVRADNGTETEIDLATDFSVTRSEVDRD